MSRILSLSDQEEVLHPGNARRMVSYNITALLGEDYCNFLFKLSLRFETGNVFLLELSLMLFGATVDVFIIQLNQPVCCTDL